MQSSPPWEEDCALWSQVPFAKPVHLTFEHKAACVLVEAAVSHFTQWVFHAACGVAPKLGGYKLSNLKILVENCSGGAEECPHPGCHVTGAGMGRRGFPRGLAQGYSSAGSWRPTAAVPSWEQE